MEPSRSFPPVTPQAAAEQAAELERAEAAREAEVARRAERQDAGIKRRQLREVISWIKAAARCPKSATEQNRLVGGACAHRGQAHSCDLGSRSMHHRW